MDTEKRILIAYVHYLEDLIIYNSNVTNRNNLFNSFSFNHYFSEHDINFSGEKEEGS